ncbi:MAG: hypothetical protein K1X75_14240 [Leptospirales bacterium]|nr:hypothetical protein [Leptospirales bacterium]
MRRRLDDRPALADLDSACGDFARGIDPYDRRAAWGPTGLIAAIVGVLSLDAYAIYALAMSNPWYGFAYFGFGYAGAAYETFPPFPLGGWCGSPVTPEDPPAEFFYFLVPGGETPAVCQLDAPLQRQLLAQLELGPRSGDDQEIDRYMVQSRIEFVSLLAANGRDCVLAVRAPPEIRNLQQE